MNKRISGPLLCFSALFFASLGIHADTVASNLQVIKLKNGFNEVHFDGLDQKTLVVIAHRDNYNAHSYDLTTMYVDYKPTDKYEPNGLQIIPVIEKSEDNTHNISTDGGADCMLHDYRLVKNTKTHETWLIVGDRNLGESYADTESVIFTFYKLAFHKDQTPGFPPFSFEYWKEQKGKHKYCDIEEAFRNELGLESYRMDIDNQ